MLFLHSTVSAAWPQEHEAVLNGNACLKFCIRVIQCARRRAVRAGLEQPKLSLMWSVAELRQDSPGGLHQTCCL